jgi:predicted nucleic acid-binding protein
MSAFVDTSVWFAAAAKRDAQNERAKSKLAQVAQENQIRPLPKSNQAAEVARGQYQTKRPPTEATS